MPDQKRRPAGSNGGAPTNPNPRLHDTTQVDNANLLLVALSNAARGWPSFPVKGKAPLPGSRGFLDASCDLDEIQRMPWHRATGVGIRTGVAFDVIDCDSADALEAVIRLLPNDFDGPTVLTSRGAHIYVAPTGLPCRGGFLPGVDFKADGGYVVGSGSRHPSGHLYRFVGVGADTPLQPVPAKFLDLLRRPEPEEPPPANVERAPHSGGRPGDAWNSRGDLGAVLLRNHWQFRGVAGHNQRWVRPAKDPRDGISATFDIQRRVFYVFSGSVPEFEADKGYSPFEVLARLEHGGDHSAAARAIRAVMA